MPQTVETTVYTFDELSDSAKERARYWWIQALDSDDYADPVTEDFIRICECLGIEVSTRPVKLMGGGSRQDPVIYWSGFSSQGDGACFEGQYRANTAAVEKLAAYAPLDEKLKAIALALDSASAQAPDLRISWKHSGRYYHAYCMDFEDQTDWPEDAPDALCAETCADVVGAIRDLANWLYGQLEENYNYMVSDEVVDENILCNGYTFTEEGNRFG